MKSKTIQCAMFKTLLTCVVTLLASTTAQDCHVKLTEPGEFSSPNFPQPYNSNIYCSWEIQAIKGTQISVQFNQFAIEESVNCSKDAIIVYEGEEEIARLCGTEKPDVDIKSKLSKNDNIIIVLKTDGESNLKGFQATWTRTCGGEYHATEDEQFISSPGYPNYSPNMYCKYDIYGPKGQKVLIKYYNFDLFVTEDDCKDYLSLYTWALAYGGEPVMMQKAYFCGDDNPQNDYFEDHLTMMFNSDKKNERKGFLLSFSLLKECGGRITKPTVIIPTPFPSYPAGTSCTWTIEAPENKVVKVKFPYVSLSNPVFCGEERDYIAIYDGLKTDLKKRLAAVCGWSHIPIVVTGSGNTMTVTFTADQGGKGFLAEIIFTHLESEGCGGSINMTSINAYELKSPQIKTDEYQDFLNCQWNILAPQDKVVRIKFTSFDFHECDNYNAVSAGNNCRCNFLEIRDGSLPDSLLIGSYCGHILPPDVVSSNNKLSISLLSGVIAKFTATLIVEEPLCKPTVTQISHHVQRFQSPGYEFGLVPRGIHCSYEFHGSKILATRLLIKSIDIQSGSTPAVCDKDRLIIGKRSNDGSVGKDYKIYNWPIVSDYGNSLFNQHNLYADVNQTRQYELCGSHEFVELYIEGPFYMNLITSPESDSKTHKGIQFEVSYGIFCDRNYTEPYGRIQSTTVEDFSDNYDCYTLITAPENRTISVYFISYPPYLKDPQTSYHDIYDGNTMKASKLISTKGRDLKVGEVIEPVFSTGKYMLIHSIRGKAGKATYDLNYITTDKGRGCGGYMYSDQGVVTSPFYPKADKQDRTCVWELETPLTTRLHLKFSDFKVYGNYSVSHLKLLNRAGELMATYYNTMWTKDYISEDNYVKIVYMTTPQNYGYGWVALFAAVSPH